LTSISISSVVLRGSCMLVVARVFSIYKSICYVHEFWHRFWLNSSHLFALIRWWTHQLLFHLKLRLLNFW
jgi:hypothetical protein